MAIRNPFVNVLTTSAAEASSAQLTTPEGATDVCISAATPIGAGTLIKVYIEAYDDHTKAFSRVGTLEVPEESEKEDRKIRTLREIGSRVLTLHWRVSVENSVPPREITVDIQYLP